MAFWGGTWDGPKGLRERLLQDVVHFDLFPEVCPQAQAHVTLESEATVVTPDDALRQFPVPWIW